MSQSRCPEFPHGVAREWIPPLRNGRSERHRSRAWLENGNRPDPNSLDEYGPSHKLAGNWVTFRRLIPVNTHRDGDPRSQPGLKIPVAMRTCEGVIVVNECIGDNALVDVRCHDR